MRIVIALYYLLFRLNMYCDQLKTHPDNTFSLHSVDAFKMLLQWILILHFSSGQTDGSVAQ